MTNADVARLAGVSTMTVSRVVNGSGRVGEATRRRVQQAVETLGYEPNQLARSLTQGRTRTIGIVVPDITNPFFPEIVRGAEDTAWRAGYTMVLANTVEDTARERAALRNLAGQRVEGVIVCSTRLPDDDLVESLSVHTAAVLVNRAPVPGAAVSFTVDDLRGAALAVQHLVRSGRRRLAHLGGPQRSETAKTRREGFLLAAATAGAEVRTSHVLTCEPTEDAGHAAVSRLLRERGPFDGLVAYNDLIAVGAMSALREAGLEVPRDVAVIGCDDIRLASLTTPALTTLRIDKYRLGSLACEAVLALGRGEQPVDVTFRPELVVRESAP